jgi:predicted RNA-binding protein YlqC (UPF0109 family)
MGRDRSSQPEVDVRALVEFLARGLVDDPDQVEVTKVEERDAFVYEIDVGEQDLGKIIGKGGKTARAIRTLVNCVAPRSGKRSLVEILE